MDTHCKSEINWARVMAKKLNTRAIAARICWQIIDKGRSLEAEINAYVDDRDPSPKDKAFVQELVYGVCRWYGELDEVASHFIKSPIRRKDRVVHFVLLVGLYQLRYLTTADHAALSETVQACKQLNKIWAKNLINGCLRAYQRTPTEIEDAARSSHPDWIINALTKAWPNHHLAIIYANNQRAPMCIRVNRLRCSRDQYLKNLEAADIEASIDPNSEDGILLASPVNVENLPRFVEGYCSVQDTAAQQAAQILDVKSQQSILDACAAPGGKTAHILERVENDAHVDAVEISAQRNEQLKATLSRLALKANVYAADASVSPSWKLPSMGYDRILIDAPCSGLGVIRRHPDIKHHRTLQDVRKLIEIQRKILQNLWPLLKPGGLMLYMTCSVLPDENDHQLDWFIKNHEDVIVRSIDHPNALQQKFGIQTLPGVHPMDGFYYGLLEKSI